MDAQDLGEGARLAPLTPEEAGEIYSLTDANRERLRQWFAWVDSTRSVEDSRAFLQRCLAQEEAGGGPQCAIELDGDLAGIAGFHHLDRGRRCIELGYWLGEAFEGKGLMTRAVAALCEHAFSELAVHRVELRATTHNGKSRAVARRLGFREEGTFREAEFLNGSWHDHVVYALLAQEWRGR